MSADQISVLFVCLGNICRSPLAQGVFEHLVRERGLEPRFRIASAGTGHWHIGRPPDPRSCAVATRHGITLRSRAQQIDPATHFDDHSGGFHWLIAMDRANRDDMLSVGAPAPRVRLFRSFDPDLAGRPDAELDVPDPYYGGPEGFDHVFAMVRSASAGLLDHLLKNPRAM
ncbi:MAG: low molecular weight protein-tyrosine-phosphatase [Planctomycetota bacterium]|nr:low molecular weight protein-tyrosine-phosphatase [Planctomycetota bacterium]